MNVAVAEIKDSIKDGDRLPIADFVASKAKTLIAECWQDNPKQRPTFAEIVKRLAGQINILEPSENIGSEFQLASKSIGKSKKRKSDKDENLVKRKTPNRLLLAVLAVLILVLIGGGVGIFLYINSLNKSVEIPSPTTTTAFSTKSTTAVTTVTTRTITRTPSPVATVRTLIQDDNLREAPTV